MRLAFALALFLAPLVLLADEPGSDESGESEESVAAEPEEAVAPADVDPPAEAEDPVAESAPEVIVATVDSVIQVVIAEFIAEVTAEADRVGAEALIVELSTPGGEMQAMRKIFTSFLEAATPVVVYVSPSGAQAASAGFFILLGADVAAMTPGTNTARLTRLPAAARTSRGRWGRR